MELFSSLFHRKVTFFAVFPTFAGFRRKPPKVPQNSENSSFRGPPLEIQGFLPVCSQSASLFCLFFAKNLSLIEDPGLENQRKQRFRGVFEGGPQNDRFRQKSGKRGRLRHFGQFWGISTHLARGVRKQLFSGVPGPPPRSAKSTPQGGRASRPFDSIPPPPVLSDLGITYLEANVGI